MRALWRLGRAVCLGTMYLGSVCLGAGFFPMASTAASEVTVPATARTWLQLTAYDDGVAFVRERRAADLPAGLSEVALEGVAPRLIPASVIVTSDDARVLGVRYDLAVLSPEALLQKFIGKEVGVIRTNPKTGEERREQATVLTTTGGLVLRFADRIETGRPERLVFDAVPPDLRLRPTLLASIDSPTTGRRPVDLSYLAGGVDWSADYALTFDPVRQRLAVNGRAILSNASGIGFPEAKVALVAGEVNREAPLPELRPRASAKADMAMAAAPVPGAPERETIGDAHLYVLPQPITLADNETRQIPLFATTEVPAQVVYVSTGNPYPTAASDGVERSHPTLQISFVNTSSKEGERSDAGHGPGVPLPAGIARVYVADSSGSPRLIGEDKIEHTPVGERVELEPGKAFDITVSRRQTAFNRLDATQSLYEATYAISVKNAKDRAADVRIVESLPGDWQIITESTPHQKVSANSAVWLFSVPTDGEVELSYKVRVRL